MYRTGLFISGTGKVTETSGTTHKQISKLSNTTLRKKLKKDIRVLYYGGTIAIETLRKDFTTAQQIAINRILRQNDFDTLVVSLDKRNDATSKFSHNINANDFEKLRRGLKCE